MERIILEHEITTEHKMIREITTTYVTSGGVEKLWNNHRGSVIAPGALNDEGVYTVTDTSSLSQDMQDLSATCWTPAIHTAYEAKLTA